jgi:arginase family enzyme
MSLRLCPHVLLHEQNETLLVKDARTGDVYPVGLESQAVLRRLARGQPPPSPGDADWLRYQVGLAALDGLGVLVGESESTGGALWQPAECPLFDSPKGATPEAGGAGVCIIGLPWDFASGLSGAAVGPQLLRAAARAFSPERSSTREWPGWYSYERRSTLLEGVPFEDWGDLRAPVIADYGLVERALRPGLRELQARSPAALPVFLGGEHGLTLSVLRCLEAGPVALVHVDAHDDYEASGETNHGSFIRDILAEGLADSIHLLGVRGLAPASRARDLDPRIRYMTARELRHASDQQLTSFFQTLAERPVYLSVDVDALDPAIAPGTRCLRQGGLLPEDIVRLASSVAKTRVICGFDLMEISPRRSPTDLTAMIAVELMLEICHAATTERTRAQRSSQPLRAAAR